MKNDTTTAQVPNDLRDELKALITEAEKFVAGSASEISDDLHARFDAARDQVVESYGDAKDKVIAGARSTNAAIHKNPYQSLAIILGLGVLLGVLAGRGSK